MSLIASKAKTYCRYWQSGREQMNEGVFPTVLFVVPDDNRRTQDCSTLCLSFLPNTGNSSK